MTHSIFQAFLAAFALAASPSALAAEEESWWDYEGKGLLILGASAVAASALGGAGAGAVARGAGAPLHRWEGAALGAGAGVALTAPVLGAGIGAHLGPLWGKDLGLLGGTLLSPLIAAAAVTLVGELGFASSPHPVRGYWASAGGATLAGAVTVAAIAHFAFAEEWLLAVLVGTLSFSLWGSAASLGYWAGSGKLKR